MTWTLHHGDCLDPVTGLAGLADKSVDVTIADPPYEAEAHEHGKRQNPTRDGQVRVVDDGIDFDAITEEERLLVALHIARVTVHVAAVFCQVEAVAAWRSAFELAGMPYRRTIPWVKPDAMPSLHGRWPGQAFESIVIAQHVKARTPPIGGASRTYSFSRDRERPHPTVKPLPLMLAILEDFTRPGDLVLDTHSGSGTTGVACNQLGRHFIGWERDANYHAIATRRLRGDEARPNPAQPSLFGGAA